MFIDISSYDKIPQMLGKVLDCTSKVHEVIASNIANAETPGFKAKEVSFQSLLSSYVDNIDMARPSNNKDYLDFEPEVVEIKNGKIKRDGNTVDLDAEMVKLAQNQMRNFEAIQLLRKKGSMLSYAITEGR